MSTINLVINSKKKKNTSDPQLHQDIPPGPTTAFLLYHLWNNILQAEHFLPEDYITVEPPPDTGCPRLGKLVKKNYYLKS